MKNVLKNVTIVALCFLAASTANASKAYDAWVAEGAVFGPNGTPLVVNDIGTSAKAYANYIKAKPVTHGNGKCLRPVTDVSNANTIQVCKVDELYGKAAVEEYCGLKGAVPLVETSRPVMNDFIIPSVSRLNIATNAYTGLETKRATYGTNLPIYTRTRYVGQLAPTDFPKFDVKWNPNISTRDNVLFWFITGNFLALPVDAFVADTASFRVNPVCIWVRN